MLEACLKVYEATDITICAAAVADYRPIEKAPEKIKKGEEDNFHLGTGKNPDILATLGKMKRRIRCWSDLPLKRNNEMEHALKKLESKKADMMILIH